MFFGSLFVFIFLIAHLHLVVWATSERFPQVKATFRVGLANESHWLQPVLVGNIHWWIAPVNVGGLLYEIVASSNFKIIRTRLVHPLGLHTIPTKRTIIPTKCILRTHKYIPTKSLPYATTHTPRSTTYKLEYIWMVPSPLPQINKHIKE
jgi:hypothetical protein